MNHFLLSSQEIDSIKTNQRLLQQENEDLKESLKEHQSVLELIMSKYRDQMLKFIQVKKQQELAQSFLSSSLSQVNVLDNYI